MAALLKKEQSLNQESVISLQGLVELDVEISDIKAMLDLKMKERELVLKCLVDKNITHEGEWSLVRQDTTRRSVDAEELRKKYPITFAKVAKITVSVTDLEKVLEEDKMKDLITTKVFTKYVTVYDPHGQQA